MKSFTAFFLLICSLQLNAQYIEGTISDLISGEKMVGASVEIMNGDNGTVTNSSGSFLFENLEPGLYEIRISYLGYKTQTRSEIWVKNGKTAFVSIQLEEDPMQLDELVIAGQTSISSISSIPITEERINRIAASYNDPARLITATSDAVITHDQNNQISVRGLSPSLNTWRLEGVEIVNPNHLTNAGTFNDQPAASGGGVNILSAQMLGKSEFMIGQMDNTSNNGVAGIFDMNMRNGYIGGHQYTAQASFIGFDFSAEGPLTKKKTGSYIVNYRYSFTGLLGLMGVDFDGETIGFQDL